MLRAPEPADVAELLGRASALVGVRLGDLAARLGRSLAGPAVRTKGKPGELVEAALGATGVGREPDFPALQIELKTVPVSVVAVPGRGSRLRPDESTFVAALADEDLDATWRSSWVRAKLSTVLFVPLATGPTFADRIVLPAVLFRLEDAPDDDALLGKDFEEHLGTIALHGLDAVTAHAGDALQIRPKAAHGRVRTHEWGPEGARIATVPRGFYLRPRFVERLLTGPPAVAGTRDPA